MESRRLFVGGLHSEVSESDLRDRFKSFGGVSAVEIVKRMDETGCPIKTFAYLDVQQSEHDFKRCVSLLSNTKWKGGSLKVQAAKESFLARLEKERQQQNQINEEHAGDSITMDRKNDDKSNAQKMPEESSIPHVLPKAVPGTPLPGKKNWVVGKFGRVLPIVYLRRRDRKKIAKFDPSKTTHCLKKIGLEETNVSVSELTWSLNPDKNEADTTTNDNNDSSVVVLKKVKKHKAKKSNLQEDEVNRDNQTFAGHSSDVKGCQKDEADTATNNDNNDSSLVVLKKVKKHKTKKSNIQDEEVDSDNQTFAGRTSGLKRCRKVNLTEDKGSDKHGEFLPVEGKSSESEASVALPGTDHGHGHGHSEGIIETNGVNGVKCSLGQVDPTLSHPHSQKNKSSPLIKQTNSDDFQELLPVLPGKKKVHKLHIDELDDISKCATVENGKGEENVSQESDSNEEKTSIEVSRNNLTKSTSVLEISNDRFSSQEKEFAAKQQLSNEKRLGAVQEKLKHLQTQKGFIQDALQNLDHGKKDYDGQKHVVFSDGDDDGASDGTTRRTTSSSREKISGSKASSWLGLDSDSDEEGDQTDLVDDDKGNELFTIKPQFEGKDGEKLFKLQKSFGGDKRFNLDERFLDSDEESANGNSANYGSDRDSEVVKEHLSVEYGETTASVQKEGDEITKSLANEKAMSMNVLQSMFGGNYNIKFGTSEIHEKESSSRSPAAVHYDPTREDHKLYEQTAVEGEVQTSGPSAVEELPSAEPVVPQVSGDKYYDVNTPSLTKLFGEKSQDASTFTFFSRGTEEDEQPNTTDAADRDEGVMEKLKTNHWSSSKLPYDSSSDDDDAQDFGDDVINPDHSSVTSQLDELFFFHPDDPELSNRLNGEKTPFMRTGSLEEVTEYWVSVRSELTQDYKRKRKDAVRIQKKLAAKRAKLR